jgi:hypothetical protein
MTTMEGEMLKHKLTGQLYQVKIIKNGTFILESKDTPYRLWFDEGDLKLFFEMAEKKMSKK